MSNMGPLVGGDIEEGSFEGCVSSVERNISPVDERIKKMVYGECTNVISNDIEIWASSLESKLEDVPKYMCKPGHPGRVGRIPENLREVDRKSYEPCYLSIGPYYYGKLNLQHVEKTKWVVLKCFLEQKPELSLKDILKELMCIEPEARNFYTDVEMDTEKFVHMLLLDSLYLVVVFCGMPKDQRKANYTNIKIWSSMNTEDKNDGENQINEEIRFVDDDEDTLMMKMTDQCTNRTSGESSMNGPAWYWTLLVHDLFLLENQLPFFVLQKMHDLAFADSGIPLLVAIKNMFHDLQLDYVNVDSEIVMPPTGQIHHILHLCHLFFCPSLQQDLTTCKLSDSNQMFRLGSAAQLYEAGVSFEVKALSTQHSLLDITISSSGKLVMPCLHVDDNTNSLLRNLIALEQMKYPYFGLDVSAYAVLLLHLVTTPRDVKLLRRKGIIQHHLASDKEMMYLINRLSVGLAFDYVEDSYSLKPIFHELKSQSNHRVPRWRAWLKHKYFNNPWTTMSLVAASLLLFLTALQTFYAVYSYYYPYFDGGS